MQVFVSYCTATTLAGIVLNAFFLVVTNLQHVEGFQEVLMFSSNISVVYILLAVIILLVMPRSITFGSSSVHIAYGLLTQSESSTLVALSSFGVGCFLYAMLCFCVMFLYRYNVTCKTQSSSTLFSRKNIKIFLGAAVLLSLIQAALFGYSQVDSNFLLLRLNVSKWNCDSQLQVADSSNGILTLYADNESGPTFTNISASRYTQVKYTTETQQQIFSPQGLKTMSVFGTDFIRNPMFFLAISVLGIFSVICSLIVLFVSMVVACKLRGRQENMSDKLRSKHQWLMTVLIFKAYVPIILLTLTAANYFVCTIRSKSMLFQQFIGTVLMSTVPLTLPIVNLLFLPELRKTALQLLFCVYWRKRSNDTQKSKNQNNNEEELNVSQRRMVDNLIAQA